MPPERAVIWDIDGTLVSPSLERIFLRFLTERRLVKPRQIAGRLLGLWLRGRFPSWYRIKIAYLRGEGEEAVAEWIEQCWTEEIHGRLHPGAVEAIRIIHERDTPQLLLSGTLDRLALKLARHVGVDQVSAARPEIIDDRYTGALLEPHPHGRIKVTRARTWLDQNGFTWPQVTAFADHSGDRFLLTEVGQSVAVNPAPGLRRLAEKRGWAVAADADLPGIVRAAFPR